jgi:hypothetical protein
MLDVHDKLLSMLDDSDAIAVMARLPGVLQWPDWSNTIEDIALGRWVAAWVGDDRARCVAAALAAVRVVAPRLPPASEDSAVTPEWIEAQRWAVSSWIAEPSAANQSAAMASFDPTRQTRAWTAFDLVDAWVAEASDFAVHAVLAGDLQGHVTPPSPRACAALAAVCAARALVLDGVGGRAALVEVASAIAADTATLDARPGGPPWR